MSVCCNRMLFFSGFTEQCFRWIHCVKLFQNAHEYHYQSASVTVQTVRTAARTQMFLLTYLLTGVQQTLSCRYKGEKCRFFNRIACPVMLLSLVVLTVVDHPRSHQMTTGHISPTPGHRARPCNSIELHILPHPTTTNFYDTELTGDAAGHKWNDPDARRRLCRCAI